MAEVRELTAGLFQVSQKGRWWTVGRHQDGWLILNESTARIDPLGVLGRKLVALVEHHTKEVQ